MSALAFDYITARLRAHMDVFRGLLSGVSDEQARWKPSPDKWSLLEVTNHLADEEVEDFRTRVRLTIESPDRDWPRIDPERWAVDRAYNTRDVRESLARFVRERNVSLAWLSELQNIPWEATHPNQGTGPLRVGDLIASWLVHDLIHIRQMNRLQYEYLASRKHGFSADYAGKW
ncbi:MAG TPA: DinB family protein [Terriglobia bacterium]|nr:DinB family protein [Terriglobia bacterium]